MRTISSAVSIGLINKFLRPTAIPLPAITSGSKYQFTSPSTAPEVVLPNTLSLKVSLRSVGSAILKYLLKTETQGEIIACPGLTLSGTPAAFSSSVSGLASSQFAAISGTVPRLACVAERIEVVKG